MKLSDTEQTIFLFFDGKNLSYLKVHEQQKTKNQTNKEETNNKKSPSYQIGFGLPVACNFMCKVGLQRESEAFVYKLYNGNAVKCLSTARQMAQL